ncbi:hypothetical protein [Bacillus nakamurai]|uniref:hypothetical protein n=1 Tax=Bacillus nakamurai TaxID=1793963 RepID=UPI000B2B1987|nr:hypothetical protein [Bacillus nakamurai]MCC9022499.1 hypothetical protein [Bacillus nakamurai]
MKQATVLQYEAFTDVPKMGNPAGIVLTGTVIQMRRCSGSPIWPDTMKHRFSAKARQPM